MKTGKLAALALSLLLLVGCAAGPVSAVPRKVTLVAKST